jgi:hypothetical protein
MKFFFLILAACAFFSVNASATERDHEFSVGAMLGLAPAAPWSPEAFKNSVGTFNPRAGIFGRFHFMFPDASVEAAYDRFGFQDSNLGIDAFTIGLQWRWLPETNLHPILMFGGGIAQTQQYFGVGGKDLAIYKVRLGIEVECRHQFDVGFYLDHFSVFKSSPAQPNIHVLVPTVAAIYYFDVPHNTAPPKEKK